MGKRKPRRRTPQSPPPPKRIEGRDPLLVEVLVALGTGRIQSRPIRPETRLPPDVQVYGCVVRDGEHADIWVNEAAHIVDTLIHELIHRVRPEWQERTVQARTKRIFWSLSHAEIERIYDLYLATRRVVRKPGIY